MFCIVRFLARRAERRFDSAGPLSLISLTKREERTFSTQINPALCNWLELLITHNAGITPYKGEIASALFPLSGKRGVFFCDKHSTKVWPRAVAGPANLEKTIFYTAEPGCRDLNKVCASWPFWPVGDRSRPRTTPPRFAVGCRCAHPMPETGPARIPDATRDLNQDVETEPD
jgi:hypothetical protein